MCSIGELYVKCRDSASLFVSAQQKSTDVRCTEEIRNYSDLNWKRYGIRRRWLTAILPCFAGTNSDALSAAIAAASHPKPLTSTTLTTLILLAMPSTPIVASSTTSPCLWARRADSGYIGSTFRENRAFSIGSLKSTGTDGSSAACALAITGGVEGPLWSLHPAGCKVNRF